MIIESIPDGTTVLNAEKSWGMQLNEEGGFEETMSDEVERTSYVIPRRRDKKPIDAEDIDELLEIITKNRFRFARIHIDYTLKREEALKK